MIAAVGGSWYTRSLHTCIRQRHRLRVTSLWCSCSQVALLRVLVAAAVVAPAVAVRFVAVPVTVQLHSQLPLLPDLMIAVAARWEQWAMEWAIASSSRPGTASPLPPPRPSFFEGLGMSLFVFVVMENAV